MIMHGLLSIAVLVHLIHNGTFALPSRTPAMKLPFGRDVAAVSAGPPPPRFAGRQPLDSSDQVWMREDEGEEVTTEEQDGEEETGKDSTDSPVFGKQKRFFRPADEERREKFEELRERNIRDQERRRQQRQLRKSEKERKTRANPDHSKKNSGDRQPANRFVLIYVQKNAQNEESFHFNYKNLTCR